MCKIIRIKNVKWYELNKDCNPSQTKSGPGPGDEYARPGKTGNLGSWILRNISENHQIEEHFDD